MACILVAGAGLVGRFVAIQLAMRGHEVTAVDADGAALSGLDEHGINTVESRIGGADTELLSSADVVVNALPGSIGDAIRETLLSIEGMRVADLAFAAQDPERFDDLAKRNGALMVHDVGIAPGLSNMVVAQYAERSKLKSVEIRVGGNPQQPDEDWSYMAPFSPSDVIAEYTRPARIRREGKEVVLPALGELHPIEVEGYGLMEAFLTDGLRSLLGSIDAEDMAEYTVRWPGHLERWQKWLLNDENDEKLIAAWAFDSTRPEFTWLQVKCESIDGNTGNFELLDEGGDGWSSMARTTGYVTVEVADMLASGGRLRDTLGAGVHPAEALIAHPDALERCLSTMREAGMCITHSNSEST